MSGANGSSSSSSSSSGSSSGNGSRGSGSGSGSGGSGNGSGSSGRLSHVNSLLSEVWDVQEQWERWRALPKLLSGVQLTLTSLESTQYSQLSAFLPLLSQLYIDPRVVSFGSVSRLATTSHISFPEVDVRTRYHPLRSMLPWAVKSSAGANHPELSWPQPCSKDAMYWKGEIPIQTIVPLTWHTDGFYYSICVPATRYAVTVVHVIGLKDSIRVEVAARLAASLRA
eukprot:TRINITY_DN3832_c0_g6_i1.p1 TRINITY_DN3832_c0_g6~~TRINITY_DN3832_c0_g6_i1.p1  ORF type:complete len:226 (-),score=54.46 TRINITY_DN3832_c0_g6_i1:48-725(-)